MAVINFNDYIMTDLSYKRNDDFIQTDDNIGYEPKFQYSVQQKDDNYYIISINVQIESDNFPFQASATMKAKFKFSPEVEGETFEKYFPNAMAIIYPYLRNSISQLSLMSNEFEALQFPTINLYKMLYEKNGREN